MAAPNPDMVFRLQEVAEWFAAAEEPVTVPLQDAVQHSADIVAILAGCARDLIGAHGHPDCTVCRGSGLMQTTMDTLNPHEGGEAQPCDQCPGLPGARVRLANMARDIDLGLTPLCAWPDQLSNPTSETAKATAHDIGLVLAALAGGAL